MQTTFPRNPPTANPVVLALAFLAAVSCDGKLRHRQEERMAGRVPVPDGVERLEVAVDHGSITVLASAAAREVDFDGTTLRAADTGELLGRLAELDLTLHPEVVGTTLRLRAPALPAGMDPEAARLVVRGVVRCPPRLHVTVRTGIGNVKVDGAAGADARAAQGDIVLAHCRGPAAVHTDRGEILVDQHRGGLTAAAPRGSVRAFLAELAGPGVQAEARDALELHLPRATPLSVDARCASGRCRNAFGLTIREDGEATAMAGEANGGGPLLHLRSARGPLLVTASD